MPIIKADEEFIIMLPKIKRVHYGSKLSGVRAQNRLCYDVHSEF